MKTNSRTDRAFVFMVDGTKRYVEPKNGKDFKLAEIKELLGMDEDSSVQFVPLTSKRMQLWCDEDGIGKKLPTNSVATMYCAVDVIMGPDGVQGNVLICEPGMIE